MLERLFNTNRQLFNDIAQAWLTAGAAGFSVTAYEQPVATWPDEAACAGVPTISAKINCMGLTVGHLHLFGLPADGLVPLLQANAQTIARFVIQEGEIDSVTTELIDAQDQLVALYDINQSTRKMVAVGQILETLSKTSMQLIKTDAAFNILFLEEGETVVNQYPPDSITAEAVETAVDLLVNSDEPYLNNGNDVRQPLPAGIENWLLCPAKVEGETRAIIGVANRSFSDFYSPDLKLLQAIAQQAGAQIENRLLVARTVAQAKVETEMQMARNVQMGLLTADSPRIAGLELTARSLPALEVGGDFYDFIPQDDGSLTFVLGDVSGKGMPSALLMAMIRTAVRSSARSGRDMLPDQLMARVNQDLYDDFTNVEMFATAVIGHYHPTAGRIMYANAGHAPMIYLPAGGAVQMLEADGPGMGMLPMSLSENQTIPFGPGDCLVIATDGFNEARNDTEGMIGYEQLLALVAGWADLPAETIAQNLFDYVADYSAGHPQDDDQTLMVIKGVR